MGLKDDVVGKASDKVRVQDHPAHGVVHLILLWSLLWMFWRLEALDLECVVRK